MLRTIYLKIEFFALSFFQLKLHNGNDSSVAQSAESAHHITRVGHHKLAACAERFIRLNAWTFRRIIPNDGEQIISSGRVWKTIIPIFIGLGLKSESQSVQSSSTEAPETGFPASSSVTFPYTPLPPPQAVSRLARINKPMIILTFIFASNFPLPCPSPSGRGVGGEGEGKTEDNYNKSFIPNLKPQSN